jgi:mono/diheme cytochrome c family protein
MKRYQIFVVCGMAWTACAFFITACASPGGQSAGNKPDGSRLWAQNCIRCHNSRSPTSYSEAQWGVTMLHMRIRAGLTVEQHRAILSFLEAAD